MLPMATNCSSNPDGDYYVCPVDVELTDAKNLAEALAKSMKGSELQQNSLNHLYQINTSFALMNY